MGSIWRRACQHPWRILTAWALLGALFNQAYEWSGEPDTTAWKAASAAMWAVAITVGIFCLLLFRRQDKVGASREAE